MFAKIDKKIMAIAIVVLFFIAVFGVVSYKYLISSSQKVETSTEQERINTAAEQNSNVQLQNPNIQIDTGNNDGGLTVCSDKCGDGICQKEKEAKCDNLNCICIEDKAECPQDCP